MSDIVTSGCFVLWCLIAHWHYFTYTHRRLCSIGYWFIISLCTPYYQTSQCHHWLGIFGDDVTNNDLINHDDPLTTLFMFQRACYVGSILGLTHVMAFYHTSFTLWPYIHMLNQSHAHISLLCTYISKLTYEYNLYRAKQNNQRKN